MRKKTILCKNVFDGILMNSTFWGYMLLIVFLVIVNVLEAQSVFNSSNMMVGKIEIDGTVRDRNNMMIGIFESDGDVRDKNYMLVGKIERGGTIRDKNYMLLGKVDPDGTVKDKNNMMIGKVKSDGTVVDRNNMTIGYARGIDIKQVAVFFFFKLFHSNPMND